MALELELVTMVNADLGPEAPILDQFGRTIAADGVYIVVALEVEEDDADAGFALQAGLKGAEL